MFQKKYGWLGSWNDERGAGKKRNTISETARILN